VEYESKMNHAEAERVISIIERLSSKELSGEGDAATPRK
jgi:hypothetical protein